MLVAESALKGQVDPKKVILLHDKRNQLIRVWFEVFVAQQLVSDCTKFSSMHAYDDLSQWSVGSYVRTHIQST